MAKQPASISNLRIAAPCSVDWERMTGDERVRFCASCNLHVYNIAEMTDAQVGALLKSTEGRLCARLYRRADGTVLTRDCPIGLRALRRRGARAAGAALAALLSMYAVAFGQSAGKKDQSCVHLAQLKIKRTALTAQQGMFTGVIKDVNSAVIPTAEIFLTDEHTKQRRRITSTEEGEFGFISLPGGRYTVEVTAPGFKSFKLKHMELNENEATRAEIILKVAEETVMVGIVADNSLSESSNIITIIRGEMIRRLPLPD